MEDVEDAISDSTKKTEGFFKYVFKMGDQPLHVSESLKKDIYKFLLKLVSEPQKKERFKDAKNLFSKYNLSDKERSKIEDTDSIFDNL